MLIDDYTLAILPLTCLLTENPEIGQCCVRTGKDQTAYHKVMRTGVLGYQLYAYHGLVRNQYGEKIEEGVRAYHVDMLSHIGEFGPLLAIIDDAVGIGSVITSTSQGEITTPVEMNVALALLLGLPVSPHYVTNPARRPEQITLMAPEIDWYFADLLAHSRREMLRICEGVWCNGGGPLTISSTLK